MMFTLVRTIAVTRHRLHHFLPSCYNNSIKLVEISNHVRFKHKAGSGSGGGGGLHYSRSGKRESGNTHHGKFEKEIEENEKENYVRQQDDEESNKLLNDR